MKQTTIFLTFFLLSFFVFGLTFAQEETNSEPATKETDKNDTTIADDNPGMPLLDQAIEEKLKATNEQDLGNVLALALRARKEGLKAENLKFCDEFIASVQLQRGILLSSRIVSKPVDRLPESWVVIRTRALSDLESAVKIIKTQPEIFVRIAQLQLMPEGNQEKAKEALDKAEAISKNQPDIYAQIIVMKTMLENDPTKREELLARATKEIDDQRLIFFHAISLIDLKKYDESINLLQKVLAKEPDNPQALQLLLEVHRNLKQFNEALSVLDKLEKILSFDAAVLTRAKIYADMGKKQESLDILDKLLEKLPDNLEILLLHAVVASEMKQFDKAIKGLDTAIKLVGNENKQQVRSLKTFKVQVFIAMDKFDEAIKILDELEKDVPDELSVKIMRIEILNSQKKHKDALEIVDSLLEQNKENLALLRMKGNLFISMQRHSDAIKVFEEIIKADPTDKTSLNNLSWILSTSPVNMVRNGKRALELAERACELTEYKVSYILSTLAAAYAELGNYEKAIEFSQKSIDLSSDDPNVKDRVNDLKEELETYKKNMPYREIPTDKTDKKE